MNEYITGTKFSELADFSVADTARVDKTKED